MAISSLLTGGDEAPPPPAGRPSSAGGLKAEPSAACRPPAHPRAAVGFGGLPASAIAAAEAAAARSVADRVGHPLTVCTALLLRAPDGVVLAARPGGGGGGGALEPVEPGSSWPSVTATELTPEQHYGLRQSVANLAPRGVALWGTTDRACMIMPLYMAKVTAPGEAARQVGDAVTVMTALVHVAGDYVLAVEYFMPSR